MGASVAIKDRFGPGNMLGELVDICAADLEAYGYAVNSHMWAAIILNILRLTTRRITESDEIRRQVFEKFAI